MRVAVAVVVALLAGALPAHAAEWLAGDLHVHTCFSHDAFCAGVDDPAEEPESLYTASLDVGQRFAEARLRGLHFLAITDHNDARSVTDPGFGSAGVLGIPGYENSLDGHAQMLGATRLYDEAGDAAAQAEALRADGGVFQANHPANASDEPFDSCDDTAALDWSYGYELEPDTIEVLNPTSPMLPALRYLECWLDRGARIGVTGGSDSHWLTISAVQGAGNPTTWALARRRTADGVLAALRRGRTTISKLPPVQNAGRLVIEAAAREGGWTPVVGRRVRAGTPLRARVIGGVLPGFLDVRANGAFVADRVPLAAGQTFEFAAGDRGWVRGSLHSLPARQESGLDCAPRDQPASSCVEDHTTLAITSAVYVR